jgi:hypothetical protein
LGTFKERRALSPGMQTRDLSDHVEYEAGRGIE